jgi:hypothetical protein
VGRYLAIYEVVGKRFEIRLLSSPSAGYALRSDPGRLDGAAVVGLGIGRAARGATSMMATPKLTCWINRLLSLMLVLLFLT